MSIFTRERTIRLRPMTDIRLASEGQIWHPGAVEDEQPNAPLRDQRGNSAGSISASISEEAPVEVHKPKAVHSWRELVNEIGVIVIGVLIALGAEQAVEALHWHHQVDAGIDALRDDVGRLVEDGASREAMSPCLGRRLSAIAVALDEAAKTGRLPAIGQLGSPGMRDWNFTSWDALTAAQTPAHMTRNDMLTYGSFATTARAMKEYNRAEVSEWANLYTIVGPGRKFGDAEQAAVRAALSRAVLLAKTERIVASNILHDVDQAGILSRSEITQIRRRVAARYAIDARDGIMCKPLDAAPPAEHYGQAPSPIDLSQPFVSTVGN